MNSLPTFPQETSEPLIIADALAPFFIPFFKDDQQIINWSKVPFAKLEKIGLTQKTRQKISRAFTIYCSQLTRVGFTAISLDDMPHLVVLEEYSKKLKKRISLYQVWYQQLIAIAKQAGLKVFVTTDVVSLAKEIAPQYGGFSTQLDLFTSSVRRLFSEFSDIDGLVLRIGEHDAENPAEDFQSVLSIRTPQEARQLITKTLPILKEYGATLIFRTWTVGAYPIGDLLWNPSTFQAVFTDLIDPNLIVSIKHGETDFFRYLALNPTIPSSGLRFIVEFQAKREYEGSGILPNFVGTYHHSLIQQVQSMRGFAGISVWVQTGGWTPMVPLAYLEPEAIWNELNAWVTVRLVTQPKQSLRKIITDFCLDKPWAADTRTFVQLAFQVEKLITEIFYIDAFAKSQLYFRRTRLPPLLWIHWQTIYITDFHRLLLKISKAKVEWTVLSGSALNERSKNCIKVAQKIGIPSAATAEYLTATFSLLASSRLVLLTNSADTNSLFDKQYQIYKKNYPMGFTVVQSTFFASSFISTLLPYLFRTRSKYRFLDRVLISNLGVRLLQLIARPVLQSKLARQAMGLTTLLR